MVPILVECHGVHLQSQDERLRQVDVLNLKVGDILNNLVGSLFFKKQNKTRN